MWKRRLSVLVWTAKTELFENADVNVDGENFSRQKLRFQIYPAPGDGLLIMCMY